MSAPRSSAAGLLPGLLTAILLLVQPLPGGAQAPAAVAPTPGEPMAEPAAEPPAEPAAEPAAPADTETPAPDETPPLKVLPTGGIKVETAALIMSGQQGGPIPVVALGVPFQGTGERALVPVLVEIKGASLLTDQPGPLRFDVNVYVIGAKSDVQGTLVDTVEVDVARLGPLLVKSGVKLVGQIALLPGEYTLRVLVRERSSELLGLRSFPLSVPNFKSGGPWVSPPLFRDPPDTWLVARSSGLKRAEVSRLALLEGEGESFPSARPILVPGEEVPCEVVAFGLSPDTALRAEIRKPEGEQVADLPVTITSRRPTDVPGLEIVSGTFEADKAIEWGEREIRIVAPGAAAPGPAAPTGAGSTVASLVRSGAVTSVLGDGGGKVWAEFGTPTGAAAQVASGTVAEGPSRRRRGVNERAVQASYRRALLSLASGDENAAKSAVSQIEVPLLTGKNTLRFEEMAELEMKVVQPLATTQPESLVPVVMLYQLLYRDYLDRKQFLPAAHAGEMIFRLTDLYAQKGGAEAKKLAASFLVGLAQGLVSTGVSGLSERAFKRALALDPDNQIALLSLAVHAERSTRYADAVGYLEKLVRAHPEHTEGSLRLALNLARNDKRAPADRPLTDLAAAAGSPDWVASVAYQELAARMIARKETAAAGRVLESGLARLPGDEKLLLQRAMLLDTERQAGPARELLEQVKPVPDPRQRSARRRYGEMPTDELEGAWNGLKASVRQRLPSLAAAVARAGGGS